VPPCCPGTVGQRQGAVRTAFHRFYVALTRPCHGAATICVVRRKTRLAVAAIAALLALNAVLVVVQPGLALPSGLAGYFFGPKLVRAEVIVQDGGALHDYRLDRGRIRAVAADSITLLERDGTVVTVPVSRTAEITLAGRAVPLQRLRRGMNALSVRDGGNPAEVVRATR
jgi:hypothetical protein